MSNSTCDDGANPTIEAYFGDCVYDGRDMVGFALGMGSILCWLVAQLPQLITNYRTKRADALSPFFLAEWLLGDTCNLLGALLKGDQPATVVLTAQYFICMDCVLLLQYLYYTSLARRRERTYQLSRRREAQRRAHRGAHLRHGRHTHGQASLRSRSQPGGDAPSPGRGEDRDDFPEIVTVSGDGAAVAASGSGGGGGSGGTRALQAVAATAAAGTLLLVRGPQLHAAAAGAPLRRLLMAGSRAVRYAQKPWMSSVGGALGYISCLLYLSSRGSQIWRNHQRRSVEGLATGMFVCAVSANLLYGSALLLRSRSTEELLSSLPWVLGSLGTVGLDVFILAQGCMYGGGRMEKKHSSDEEEALLPASPPAEAAVAEEP